MPTSAHTPHRKWTFRVTNTADIGARLDEARLELLRRRLADRGLSSAAQDIGPHTDDRLSDGQARMWFVQMADPSGALLNICVSYRITGDIDLARLRDAVNAVARRHRILRTTYPVGDDGVAQPTVHADLRPGWTQYDLTDLSQRAQRLRLEVLAQREFCAPFELSATRHCESRWCARLPTNTCCCWWPTTSPGMMVRGGCSSPISPRRTRELT